MAMMTHNVKLLWETKIRIFQFAAKALLSALLTGILAVLAWAIVRTLFDVYGALGDGLHEVLKTAMVSSLSILAILEVFLTALTYLSTGRVKVTYIIDTVIVVVLTEVMVFWYKEIEYFKILLVMAVVLSLIAARILAIRFSPSKDVA